MIKVGTGLAHGWFVRRVLLATRYISKFDFQPPHEFFKDIFLSYSRALFGKIPWPGIHLKRQSSRITALVTLQTIPPKLRSRRSISGIYAREKCHDRPPRERGASLRDVFPAASSPPGGWEGGGGGEKRGSGTERKREKSGGPLCCNFRRA